MRVDLFGSVSSLERVLDHSLARHGVLASNLANAETPGYQPRELLPLDSAENIGQLAQTNPGHISGEASEIGTIVVEQSPVRPDENGVQLERVMAQISANRVRYEAGIEMARRRLALLRYAATDGGT